jgi:hypothetical protein
LKVSLEDVLIVHRKPCLHALKNQIVGAARFDQLVLPNRTPCPNLYGESFQAKDAGDYAL